jgi:hypothetical protein
MYIIGFSYLSKGAILAELFPNVTENPHTPQRWSLIA